MKALGILAGPRKGQTTDRMIDAALKGLQEKGVQTEKISLYDYTIQPCTGCGACHGGKSCVIKDDYYKIAEKVVVSDIIVFGCPTYFSNVTSVAKVFFDRSEPFFKMTMFGPRRFEDKPSRVFLLTTCLAPFPFSHLLRISTGCIRAMTVFFKYMKLTHLKTLTATGITHYEEKKSEPFIRKAYRIGKSLA